MNLHPRAIAAPLLAAALLGCVASHDTIYQVSTFSALQESVYDGATTLAALKRHGDLGIGTFDALDGELILVGGRVHRFGADGRVTLPPDDLRTPFASVTWFEADRVSSLGTGTTYDAFKAATDSALPTLNLPYAVRITGRFALVRTRAPRRQSPPYPRLVDALADQPEFEYRAAHGTLVGFRLPPFLAGVNVPGWHLHFLSDDGTQGGHVLAFTVEEAKLEIDVSPGLFVALPSGGDFAARDLSRVANHEVEAIEGSRAGYR